MAPEATRRPPEPLRSHPDLDKWQKKPTQDIYTLGLVTFEIATNGLQPYEDAEDFEAKTADPELKSLLERLPKETPAAFCSVIAGTTKLLPTERTTLEMVECMLRDYLNERFSKYVYLIILSALYHRLWFIS